MKLYLKLIFLLILFLHVALVKLTVFIPVRTMALFVFVGLLFLVHHRQFVNFTSRYAQIFLVFAVMAFLGGFLAVLQGEQLYSLLEHLLRHIIQPLLILSSVYLAVQIFGLTFVVNAILVFVAMSAAVAILQFLGIELAWDIRRFFGNIQGDPADIKEILRTRGRPLGLLLTPIMFSYHLVSGYVVANLLYRHGLMQPRLYALVTIVALFASAANGTRSLVLGILIHECLQFVLRGRLSSYAWLTALAVGAVGGFYYLEAIDSRLVSVEDASAVSRVVLLKFGLQLFLNNPFGYGWGLNPGDHAWLFWELLSDLPKATAIFRLGIHNAFINFLLKYGIFGLSVFALLAALNLRKTFALLVTFLAYFINALFHNAGVFVGDIYFWFAFAIFLHLYETRFDVSFHGDERRP